MTDQPTNGQPPPPPQLVRQSHRQSWQFWLGLGGAGLVALGSLLPWATVDTDHFGTHTKYGIEGDGVFTLIGGALFAVFFLLHHAPWQRAVATLIALGLVVIAVLDFSDIQNRVENTNAEAEAVSAELTASVGVGLWMVLVGSVGVLTGVLLRRSTRSRTSPQRLPFLKPPRSPRAEADSRRDRPA